MKLFLNLFLIILLITSCQQNLEKTAFVDSKKIISEYKVMNLAKEKWESKNEEVRSMLENKAKQFQIEVEGYKNIMKSMTKSHRDKKEQELLNKQKELQVEQQTKLSDIQKGSQKEIDSIIKVVKEFIKSYGKKNQYTYIFGDTESNTILYGKEKLNITDEILEALNQ